MSPRRLVLLAAALLPLAALSSASAQSQAQAQQQSSRKPLLPAGPTLSASQRVMAGAMLSTVIGRPRVSIGTEFVVINSSIKPPLRRS